MMSPPTAQCIGAILAGGGSTRMGEPKHAMILPDGRSMIQTVADTMAPLCSHLVVLGPPDALPDTPHIADLRASQGPLAGIEALLSANGAHDSYIICACDTPFVTTALMALLLAPSECPAAFLRIDSCRDPEPLPARIDACTLATVQSMLDENMRSVRQLMQRVEHEVVSIPGSRADQLTNINTPEEYEQAASRLRT